VGRRPLALLVTITMVLAACTGQGGTPTVSTTTPYPVWADETPDPSPVNASVTIDALSPSLTDTSGLLTGVDVVPPLIPFSEGIEPDASTDRGLLVSWLGTPCELQPVVVGSGSAHGLDIVIHRGPVEAGECPASAIGRTLRLQLSQPVDVRAVTLSVIAGEPQH
jgi:hypothetical protein